MIIPKMPKNLPELRCEKTIGTRFVELVLEYLAQPAREGEINDQLYHLIVFCNYYRLPLRNLCRNGTHPNQELLETWLYEFATPPNGEWSELRYSTMPFIRAFGRLPRPRGSQLFSPLPNGINETEEGSGEYAGQSFEGKQANALDHFQPI
jgi:hypothetical protein